jgi:hypothetical protein
MVGLEKKKSEMKKRPRNKMRARKKKSMRKKKLLPKQTDPWFHPIHEIPEWDFLDGALVGTGSLKPMLS